MARKHFNDKLAKLLKDAGLPPELVQVRMHFETSDLVTKVPDDSYQRQMATSLACKDHKVESFLRSKRIRGRYSFNVFVDI